MWCHPKWQVSNVFFSEIEDLAVGGRTKAAWLWVSGGRRIDKAVALSMTS